MRIRSPKDFWAGLIFIAIGGGFVLLAQQYRLGDMHRMGPAMFPTLVGALLAVLGVVIALRALAFLGEPCRAFICGRSGSRCWRSCCSA
jgi:NhaP-type Na+/H+ or K+/H+ antiporter